MTSYTWATDGFHLLFYGTPSGGEKCNVKIVRQARPHTDESDLICFGDESAARFCEDAIGLLLEAEICGRMSAKWRGNNADLSDWWQNKEIKFLTMYRDALDRARRAVGIAATGTTGRIKNVWPNG